MQDVDLTEQADLMVLCVPRQLRREHGQTRHRKHARLNRLLVHIRRELPTELLPYAVIRLASGRWLPPGDIQHLLHRAFTNDELSDATPDHEDRDSQGSIFQFPDRLIRLPGHDV